MKYRVYLTTKIKAKNLSAGSGIYVLEPDDYTKTEIKAIKAKGYKVLGYMSVGTIEKERPWWKTYKKYTLAKLKDWPDECYADLTKKDWRDFLVSRAKVIKNKGFDGWWLDNIDVYEYYKSNKIKSGIKDVLKRIKALGGYSMINGGSRYLMSIDSFDDIDAYCQEEVYSRITSYDGDGKFSTQKIDERNYYKKVIAKAMGKGVECFLLEYTKSEKVKAAIKTFYKNGNCSGYYISGKVDL